jgi:hypothetical protein
MLDLLAEEARVVLGPVGPRREEAQRIAAKLLMKKAPKKG